MLGRRRDQPSHKFKLKIAAWPVVDLDTRCECFVISPILEHIDDGFGREPVAEGVSS